MTPFQDRHPYLDIFSSHQHLPSFDRGDRTIPPTVKTPIYVADLAHTGIPTIFDIPKGMYLSICLSVYVSVCLSVYLPIYLSGFLPLNLYLYIYIYDSYFLLYIYPSIYLSIYPSLLFI